VISVSATQSWDTVTITPSGPDDFLTFFLTRLTLDGRDVRADVKGDGPWTYVPTRAGLLGFGITNGIVDAFGQLWVAPPLPETEPPPSGVEARFLTLRDIPGIALDLDAVTTAWQGLRAFGAPPWPAAFVEDASGLGRHAVSDGAARPILRQDAIGNMPAFLFSGSQYLLGAHPMPDARDSLTFIVGGQEVVASAYAGIYVEYVTGARDIDHPDAWLMLVWPTAGAATSPAAERGGPYETMLGPFERVAPVSVWCVEQIRDGTIAMRLWRNGELVAEHARPETDSSFADGYVVGARYLNGVTTANQQGLAGAIGQVVRTTGRDFRAEIEGILGHKWSMPLVPGHPYEAAPPRIAQRVSATPVRGAARVPSPPLPSLLPQNRTGQEHAIEQTQAGRIAGMDVPVDRLWNPATCPAALLPWLAWALSVDEWDDAWPEETKRRVIADSVTVHRVKGTVGAVRRALAAAGYGDALIHERWGALFYNGTWGYGDGTTYGSGANWAAYAVQLNRFVPVDEAARIGRILENVAPARCRLVVLGLPIIYGDGHAYIGQWSYGDVQWA
jgi:phage tail P2-like protein